MGARRRVTRPTGRDAFKPSRIDVLAASKEGAEKGDLRSGRLSTQARPTGSMVAHLTRLLAAQRIGTDGLYDRRGQLIDRGIN